MTSNSLDARYRIRFAESGDNCVKVRKIVNFNIEMEGLEASVAMDQLKVDDVGVLAAGRRADFVRLDAPSYVHLAYRPGVPLVCDVVKAGQHMPYPSPNPENVESRS